MIRSLRSSKCPVPLALVWSHAGGTFRLTPWPDAQLECRYGDEWVPVTPTPDALRDGSQHVKGAALRGYLEFVPLQVREFVGLYRANRIAALHVASRCPDLVGALEETPALTAFVAAHPTLRCEPTARWHELNARYERGGIYAVLEWLGLPASRQALAILRNVVAPDLSPALLEALRAALWRPQGVFALAQLTAITDRDLSDACALAA